MKNAKQLREQELKQAEADVQKAKQRMEESNKKMKKIQQVTCMASEILKCKLISKTIVLKDIFKTTRGTYFLFVVFTFGVLSANIDVTSVYLEM